MNIATSTANKYRNYGRNKIKTSEQKEWQAEIDELCNVIFGDERFGQPDKMPAWHRANEPMLIRIDELRALMKGDELARLEDINEAIIQEIVRQKIGIFPKVAVDNIARMDITSNSVFYDGKINFLYLSGANRTRRLQMACDMLFTHMWQIVEGIDRQSRDVRNLADSALKGVVDYILMQDFFGVYRSVYGDIRADELKSYFTSEFLIIDRFDELHKLTDASHNALDVLLDVRNSNNLKTIVLADEISEITLTKKLLQNFQGNILEVQL